MANDHQKIRSSRGRRESLKWMGQIAAGLSLAGLGLRLSDTNVALAKDNTNNPDCVADCPRFGTKRTVCFCPASQCNTNKSSSIITYLGGCSYGSICNCATDQPVSNGCCQSGDPCYC